MPFIANTPESLLARTDSLDPATTCHGITSGGLPCRRPLTDPSPDVPQSRRGKRAAAVNLADPAQYCWQHAEQAARHASRPPRPSHSGRPRSSIDTLTERLGLGNLNDARAENQSASGSKKKHSFSFSLCCCIPISIPALDNTHDDETPPPPRPVRPGKPASKRTSPIPPSAPPETAAELRAELAKPFSQQDDPGYIYIFWLIPESGPGSNSRSQPNSPRGGLSTPETHISRRPGDVLAAFAATAFDAFWGDSDDEDHPPPSSSPAARRARDTPRDARRAREMRSKGKQAGNKTILLKIGRATNVQRRLNEWKRQCGYDLSLVRYYPYIPSANPGAKPRKMPHSHKVERLIHIELEGAGLRVLDGDRCEACGKEHKEWFEVEATRNAIRQVDDVVKRWVDWDEGL